MSKRLESKVAIVTGAAAGMGFTIAKTLCREGAKVAIADVAEESVHSAVASLEK